MAQAPKEYTVTDPHALERVGWAWAEWELSAAMYNYLAQRVDRPPQPRRNKREAHNALERWFLTAANHNPPQQDDKVVWAVHRDLATAGFGKFKDELAELGLAAEPGEAHRWAAALLDLAETAMRRPPPPLGGLIIMIDPALPGLRARTAAGAKFFYRMRPFVALMERAKETLGGDAAAATALARASLRYAALLPGAQHWGLPLRFARQLYGAGFRYEGFASPFNSRMVLLGEKDTWFCSLFADTDFPFGSIGTFFGAPLAELGGKWMVNPPYVELVIERAARKTEMEADRASEEGVPLTVHFLLPAWEDSPAIQEVMDSQHAVLSEPLLAGRHCLESPEGREYEPIFGNLYVVWEVPLPGAPGRRAATRLAAGARGPCPGVTPRRRSPRHPRRGGSECPRLDRNNTSFPVQVTARLRALHATYLGLRDQAGGPPSPDRLAAAALHYYQYLVRMTMSAQDSWIGAPGGGGARGLLVYHAMGLGKTRLAAAAAMALWDARPPLVIVAKALQKNFTAAVAQYVALLRPGLEGPALAEAQGTAVARFRLVSLDANNMATLVARATEGSEGTGALDGRLLIVDEAHNLFRAVINSPDDKTNARQLYEMVMGARNLRILFLSGTPVSKDPFELVPCFNMLAGYDLLPAQYEVFYRLYVDAGARGVRNRGKLANRLVGLTSFASHAHQAGMPAGVEGRTREPGGFPEELALVVEELEMGPEQYRQYLLAREKEEAEGRSGDRAPAARERLSSSPPLALPSSEAGGGSTYYVRSRMLSNFAPPVPRVAGRTAGEPVEPDQMPDSAFGPEASPKATRLLANLARSPGPALIYSQFVHGGGLAVIARYLRLAGFSEFRPAARGGAGPPAAEEDKGIEGDRGATASAAILALQELSFYYSNRAKARRTAALGASPEPWPRVDGPLNALVVEAAFRSARAAGYPYVCFVPPPPLPPAEYLAPPSLVSPRPFNFLGRRPSDLLWLSPPDPAHSWYDFASREGGDMVNLGMKAMLGVEIDETRVLRVATPAAVMAFEKEYGACPPPFKTADEVCRRHGFIDWGRLAKKWGGVAFVPYLYPPPPAPPETPELPFRVWYASLDAPTVILWEASLIRRMGVLWDPTADSGLRLVPAELPLAAGGGRERRRPRSPAEGWGPPCWGEEGAQAALAVARAARIPVARGGAIARTAGAPPRRPSRWIDLATDRAGVAYHYRGSHGAEAGGPRLDNLMNLHRGQRKLFISELLGLTHFLPRADAEVSVVYAGAARGDHLVFLADLFPGATFHLYDPNPFDARLSEAPDRFRVHHGLFTDAIAQGWGGRCDVFISDIRSVTRDMSGGEAAFEARVRADMDAQTTWARLIAPRLGCILKFRPPYVDPETAAQPEQDTFECLRGRVMWQAWPPKLSTEGRLIVEAADAVPGAPPMRLDARLYQDVCFHHNTIVRPWGSFAWGRHQAPADFGDATSALRQLVPGYDGCFDCALEARAWADFLALPGAADPPAAPPTTAQVGAMMTRLTRELHKGLRSWEPPPYHGLFAGCPPARIRRALAAQKRKLPASGGAEAAPEARELAAPFLRHADRRFAFLRAALRRDPAVTVTIAGADGEPALGTGLARGQWVAYHPVFGEAAWRLVVAHLAELCRGLARSFPRRVSFGEVRGVDASPTHFVVWGANAGNWDLPHGAPIAGAGQAAAMGHQQPGVFGVVTTPMAGLPAADGESDAPEGSEGADGESDAPEGSGADGESDALEEPEGPPGTDGAPRYAVISGDVPVEERARIQEAFNSPQNAHGGVIRALLVSKTGAEGLDLKGVRQVHIFEPYWDKAREDQVKARGIRIGSHDHLSVEEREVQPFLYISVPNRAMQESMRPTQAEVGAPPAQKYRPVEVRTIDEEFHARATRRYELNGAFRALLREVSIECALSGVADCRLCVPSNAVLFHEDPMQDLRLPDSCLPLTEAEVQVLETELDGTTYFYQRDASSPLGISFFVFDSSMDAHVPVDPSTGLFQRLMDHVESTETAGT